MNKDIKKILVVLAIFSLAAGIVYNFLSLWMVDNGLSVKTVSIVLSLCALIACSSIFIFSNIIKPKMVKGFILSLLALKFFSCLILFLLNSSGFHILIKFLIMLEYALDVEILACIYPLIALISKSNKLFASKGLVYDSFYYVGVILITFLIGKNIIVFNISYNSCFLIGSVLILCSYLLLRRIDMKKYTKKLKDKSDNDLLFKLLNKIRKDKISWYYIIFSFCGNVSFNIITGIVILLLVNVINFTDKIASSIVVIMGITSAIVGAIVLSKLTLKNNYINIGIKYITRLLLYILAIMFTHKYIILIAILYTLLTSSLYIHVTDAPYINRFNNEEQLAFANLDEMVNYLSKSLGILLCGLYSVAGIKLNFVLAAVFVFIAIVFSYLALYNLNIERGS